MREALERWIGEQAGGVVGVAELRRITTGHSRGNWFLQLDDGSRYVVRVEQGGVFGTSGADEFAFMRAVGRLGFPVARVRWLEPTGTVVGQPFFVMDFIEGGVATEREDRSLAPDLAVDFVRRLDELHRLDWSDVLEGPTPSEATHVQIERWADVYRSTSPRPVPLLEEGAAWLHAHAPAARARRPGPRRSRTRELRPRRPPGAGVHRLGVLPPRRPHRGLVVPPLDARVAGRCRSRTGWA